MHERTYTPGSKSIMRSRDHNIIMQRTELFQYLVSNPCSDTIWENNIHWQCKLFCGFGCARCGYSACMPLNNNVFFMNSLWKCHCLLEIHCDFNQILTFPIAFMSNYFLVFISNMGFLRLGFWDYVHFLATWIKSHVWKCIRFW